MRFGYGNAVLFLLSLGKDLLRYVEAYKSASDSFGSAIGAGASGDAFAEPISGGQ